MNPPGLTLSGLLLFAAVMPLILGILLAIYWRTRRAYRGFGFWVFANLAMGLGYALVGLGSGLSPLISTLVGNGLLLYSILLIYEGVESFFGRRTFNVFNHLLLGVYVALLAYFTYGRPSGSLRVVLSSAALVVVHARVVYVLLTDAPESLRKTSRTIALIFILAALACALRAVYTAWRPVPADLFSDPTLLALAFASICATTILSFYLLFLNTSRVELELENVGRQLRESAGASRQELAQLSLLEETSQLIAGTLDEAEILDRTVLALVGRFGYAEATICMLVNGNQLEVAAISGTENLGFPLGYRQNVGEGIIGHSAEARQAYVTGDVEHDPYYFTIGQRSGSAAAVPLLHEGELYGVLYVESASLDAFKTSDIQMLRALAGHLVTAINNARLHARTQDHLVVMTTLHRTSQIITSSLELDRIFQTVLQLLKETFGYTYISLYQLDGTMLHLGAQIGYPAHSVLTQVPISEGIMGRAVQTCEIQFVRDAAQEPAFLRAARDINSEICVPLLKNSNVLGVMNVEGSHRNPLTERDLDVLSALAGPIAVAIDNAHLHAHAKSLARLDGLTGLINRRTFDQALEAEISRAARYEYPVCLIIVDIDDFKATNDHWGHPAGDALLRAIARLISVNIRASDSAARYGGDEFAIILPNTSAADGVELAERLRVAAQKLGRGGEDASVPRGDYTISLGVASYPEHGSNGEQLLQSADHAELMAKQRGKNRVSGAAVEEP